MRGSFSRHLLFALAGTSMLAAPAAFAQTPKPKAPAKAAATPAATPEPVMTATPATAPWPTPTVEAMTTPEAMPTPEAGAATLGAAGPSTAPRISGFLTTRYDNAAKGPPTAGANPRPSVDSFSIQHARLEFAGNVDPKLSYLLSADFAGFFVPGGFVAQSIPFVRDAYVNYDAAKWARVRAGQQQRPLGLEGRTSDRDLLTTGRTVVTRLLDASGNRDIGLVGVFTPMESLPLEIAVGTFNGSGENTSDSNPDKDVGGRVGISLPAHVKAGFSASSGKAAAVSEDDLFFPGSPNQQYEYWRAAYDVDAEILGVIVQSEGAYGKTRLMAGPILPAGSPTFGSGAMYVLVGYRTGRYGTPYLRYSYLDRTIDQKKFADPHDWRNETTLGINMELIKKTAILRAEYTLYSGYLLSPIPAPGGGTFRTDKLEGAFAASFQVNFGAK